MGADPMHKDIFVQADYMASQVCIPFTNICFTVHTHKLTPDIIKPVIQAFYKADIRLHVDCGPDCVMNPVNGDLWGDKYSQVKQPIRENATLGTTLPGTGTSVDCSGARVSSGGPIYQWGDFDNLEVSKNFHPSGAKRGRFQAFHHVVLAHNLGGAFFGHSGISRNAPASDFIVSLGEGDKSVGTNTQQAATFMHELGHNLSLHHGGDTDCNNKPNYLSVMNYLFQQTGLIRSGSNQLDILDYSPFSPLVVPNLNEASLDESVGLNGGPALATYGTAYFCPGKFPPSINSSTVPNANGPIDWNCMNGIEKNVQADIDADADMKLDVLTSFDDWSHLVLTGGWVGKLGSDVSLPMGTSAQEEPSAILPPRSNRQYDVAVTAITAPPPPLARGSNFLLSFTITNRGINDDSYTLVTKSDVNWGDFTAVPSSLAIKAGDSAQVTISGTIPASTPVGTEGKFSLLVTSQNNPSARDGGDAFVGAGPGGPPTAKCKDAVVPTDSGICSAASASVNNGSSDPNGEAITLQQSPAGPYVLGTSAVTLTVTDTDKLSSSCNANVTVVDKQPPAITCPAPVVQCTSPNGTTVAFSPTVSDNCSVGTPSCTPASGSTFPIGSTPISCSVTDGAGNSTSCSSTVTVQESANCKNGGQPLDCSTATASVQFPRLGNRHRYPVTISGVTAPQGDPVSITITSIFQDEPVTSATGKTCPDGVGVGTAVAKVRNERIITAAGNGRVYHIGFTATDAAAGKSCTGEVTVCVPKNPGSGCVDEGPLFDSTICP